MICWKDMTFCSFWRECANAADCRRALTDDVVLDAQRHGLPVATFVEKPECFEQI